MDNTNNISIKKPAINFTKTVAHKDTYSSPKEALGSKFLATPRFFYKMIMIVLRANRKAVAGKYNSLAWYDSSVDVRESLESVGIKFEFEGMDCFRKAEGPFVFIGNHMSTLETVVLPGIIRSEMPVVFVTKEELTTYPVFGPVSVARHPIIVGRTNPKEDLITVFEEGTKRLSEGTSVGIFPQKTRSDVFNASEFNSLGVKLAKKAGVKVIPVALLTDAWANGKVVKEAGKIDPNKTVYISFGEPMTVTGNGAEEHKKIISFISEKLTAWGRADLVL